MPPPKTAYDDPDDFFADTRMSFGDHIEELRTRLLCAIKWLTVCLFSGFALDGVGYYLNWPNFGIGRPAFNLITSTVEDQVRDYYHQRTDEQLAKVGQIERINPTEEARIRKKIEDHEGSLTCLTDAERRLWLGRAESIPVSVTPEALRKAGVPVGEGATAPIEVTVQVYPAYMNYLNARGEALLQSKKYLTTLSVQEPLLVYVQVSLLCGFVIASPIIFYQIWAFVAAGLYPKEKRYVHVFLPFSVGLFLAGVAMAQFLVMPSAVRALLGFNHYLGVDPDIRLNEWLTFALILPLVFGLSFQTPLVMVFMNRIGLFTYKDYLAYWRAAAMILAVAAVIILPSPDALSMIYLYVPMLGLYLLGIAICKYFPPEHEKYLGDDSDVAV